MRRSQAKPQKLLSMCPIQIVIVQINYNLFEQIVICLNLLDYNIFEEITNLFEQIIICLNKFLIGLNKLLFVCTYSEKVLFACPLQGSVIKYLVFVFVFTDFVPPCVMF